ncbi:MAG: hypothetical protein AAF253_14695, partial [Pseudomonadota bacterium]
GVHWEMWNLSQGGMTNMEVLRAATIHGAEYIGMEKSIGSLNNWGRVRGQSRANLISLAARGASAGAG